MCPEEREDTLGEDRPHAPLAQPKRGEAVPPEHLRETAHPAEALPPPGVQVLGRLHPEEGIRLVGDLEAGELEAPGQVDVLGGHVRREAADRDHRPPVEQRAEAGERHQPAPDGVAAALDPDG